MVVPGIAGRNDGYGGNWLRTVVGSVATGMAGHSRWRWVYGSPLLAHAWLRAVWTYPADRSRSA